MSNVITVDLIYPDGTISVENTVEFYTIQKEGESQFLLDEERLDLVKRIQSALEDHEAR